MTAFQSAIDEFRRRRLDVYRSDPDQVQRDVNVVSETVKDHIGRWPLELIQNCDDAESRAILIRTGANAIYVADQGTGVPPGKIKSLSGTHFSDKPAGAIGRKGLGFKAVYGITTTPAVFTGDDDGLIFCQTMARAELSGKLGMDGAGRVPYEWLPFWLSRREAGQTDPLLASLAGWRTVIRLPVDREAAGLSQALELLASLPSHVLLTFRHVRRLDVNHEEAPRSIESVPDVEDTNLWHVRDSSAPTAVRWRVARAQFTAPEEALAGLEDSDREHMAVASVMVAAPVDDAGIVVPAHDYPRVCVYYPVGEDEKSGRPPVPLLLHADFLVSSDRKQVLQHHYNDWLKKLLATKIVDFVNECFDSSKPAANLALLVPYAQRDSHPLTADLWRQIASEATNRVQLPDAQGKRRLAFTDARYVALTNAGVARQIIEPDALAQSVVHPDLDTDAGALQVLRVLGCGRIADGDLLAVIARAEGLPKADDGWLWTCWEWTASWVAEKQTWDPERAQRIEKVKQLPIIPIEGKRWRISSVGARTVITWRDQQQDGSTPDWLPVRFVCDWFRDRLLGLAPDHPVRLLAKDLGLREPDINSSLQSLGFAIEDYWAQPTSNPQRFVQFLLDRDWHERAESPPSVRRCPIPVAIEAGSDDEWHEACQSYFGTHWGSSAMATCYRDVSGIAWAKASASDPTKLEAVLEWLGVVPYPRVLEGRLDRISPGQFAGERAVSLLSLIAGAWAGYYLSLSTITTSYRYRRRTHTEVQDAPWWSEVKSAMVPPLARFGVQRKPLKECWLPDPETRRAAGELLPVLDLEAFGANRAAVETWLRQVVGLRTNLNQITDTEWRAALAARVPELVDGNPASERKRQDVQRWYDAALDSLSSQPLAHLGSVPLLCRQADTWEFRGSDPDRWLEDSADVADAFRQELWTISLSVRLHPQARKHFGVKSLRDLVKEEALYEPDAAGFDTMCQQQLDAIKPFVFAWRCYKSKADATRLRDRLFRLTVRRLPSITVRLTLPGYAPKTIDRAYHHQGDDLILRESDTDVVNLARAFSAALDLRSEANFFENLLRCSDDAARKAKLRGEEMPTDQIELRVREYGQQPEAGSGGLGSSDGQQNQGAPAPQSSQGTARNVGASSAGTGSTTRGSGAKSDRDTDKATAPADELSLKDAAEADYVVNAALPESQHRPTNLEDATERTDDETGEGNGAGTDNELLTQRQKDQIEAAARRVVVRVLTERMGYHQIEEMPPDNKGFDIKATKDGVELRVEVKGHRGTSSIAQVTDAQIQECERCLRSEGRRIWQLWNVEHLSAVAVQAIAITMVRRIPPEARKADRYRVDLRQCDICSATGNPPQPTVTFAPGGSEPTTK